MCKLLSPVVLSVAITHSNVRGGISPLQIMSLVGLIKYCSMRRVNILQVMSANSILLHNLHIICMLRKGAPRLEPPLSVLLQVLNPAGRHQKVPKLACTHLAGTKSFTDNHRAVYKYKLSQLAAVCNSEWSSTAWGFTLATVPPGPGSYLEGALFCGLDAKHTKHDC